MKWNHRVVKYKTDDVVWYGIVEAHYNDKGEIFAYTEEPDVVGNDIESLKWTLEHMLKALETPILEDGKVVFGDMDG